MNPGICYANCAAYKFFWQQDSCYYVIASNCGQGLFGNTTKAISFIYTAVKTCRGGSQGFVDVATPLKALACYQMIKTCVEPQLDACRDVCTTYPYYYAPNLTVTSSWFNRDAPGLFYDEENKMLRISVLNNGAGYASDIGVNVSYGTTTNQDRIVSGRGTLLNVNIVGLTFWGAAQAGHKTFPESVKDFMIDQTRFASYIQDYKSDKDYPIIPSFYETEIPFEAKEGEYTKITIYADYDRVIPEGNEDDNMYSLIIDKLPNPAEYKIENIKAVQTGDDLKNYILSFDLTNTGELDGRAVISITEGYGTSAGKLTLIQNISAGQIKHITQPLQFDVSKADDGCAVVKTLHISITDDQNRVVNTEYRFPLRAGRVLGRVTDLFDKPVKGAVITVSSGQTATSGENGYYHLSGINKLGKLTLTITHPDFSEPQTKEITMALNEVPETIGNFSCETTGLTHDINFILKDQDVLFNAIIKDKYGNYVNAQVLVSNKIWRFNETINGNGPLPGMQPGKYLFTISAAGYKTIAQTVNAVPNNQNLEFTMETLFGRSDDNSLVIQSPQLLWQINQGEEILSNVAATKDGNRVLIFTSRNKANTGKLYFIDTFTGNQVKVVATPATGGNSQACLSTSYDGNTTALYAHVGTTGMAQNTKNALILFNKQGSEFNRTEYPSGGGAHDCSVSYDGFYVFPGFLINKSLYEYSRFEIDGIEAGYPHMSYSSLGPLYFLHGNGIIAGCKGGGGDQCSMTLAKGEFTRFSGLSGSIRVVDSSLNDANVIFCGYEKLFVYNNGTKVVEREVNASNEEPSASISTGGNYIIYTYNQPTVHNAEFRIVTSDNVDKTPVYNKDVNEDVLFVHANDKGLFYLAEDGKDLRYYQVGKYTTDYNAQTETTTTGDINTTNLSYYASDGVWRTARSQNFNSLEEGKIYRADSNIALDMLSSMHITDGVLTSYGTLHILAGTIFSIDINQNLILLKGQMTADFNSPATIYAIKFDRYDMNLLKSKLDLFISGVLSDSEYFEIKNIHTKFTLKNTEGSFNIAVANGEVQINGKDVKETVISNKQVTIDKNNKIRKSIYLDPKSVAILIGIIILGLTTVLFAFRKTRAGSKITNILHKLVTLFWKFLKLFVKSSWKMIRIAAIWVWGNVKSLKRPDLPD
jgi:hypothetical protein